MRTVLLTALLAAGAFGAWWFFVREAPREVVEEDPSGISRDGSPPPPRPNEFRPGERVDVPDPWPPPPPRTREEDHGWRDLPLRLDSRGVLTGADVIESIRKAGRLTPEPHEPKDLEKLNATRFEDVETPQDIDHGRVVMLLHTKGFDVAVRGSAMRFHAIPLREPVVVPMAPPEPPDPPR